MKIWSLSKPENLTTGKKYCGKEEKLLLKSNFSSFPQYFQYISNFKSPIAYIFVKCGCSNCFFLNSANLTCRGTDIIESLGIRDNESRLYYTQYPMIFLGTENAPFPYILYTVLNNFPRVIQLLFRYIDDWIYEWYSYRQRMLYFYVHYTQ